MQDLVPSEVKGERIQAINQHDTTGLRITYKQALRSPLRSSSAKQSTTQGIISEQPALFLILGDLSKKPRTR